MNTTEIRANYYKQMEQTQYDRNLINDNDLKWTFLTETKNYRPLNQKFRFFTSKPMYAKQGEWDRTPW